MKDSEKKILGAVLGGFCALAFVKGFLWAWSEDKAEQRHAAAMKASETQHRMLTDPKFRAEMKKTYGVLADVGLPATKTKTKKAA